LNNNGPSKGNPGVTSVGGVLQGDRGEWIIGFTKNFGECTSVKAELRAVLYSLKIDEPLFSPHFGS